MPYPSLKKIFYTNEALWQKEYARRFDAPFAEHFDFSIKQYNYAQEYTAFLNYTKELLALLDSIHTLNFELQEVERLLPPIAIKQYLQACMVEEIQASNEIEGVRSSRKEIREAIEHVQSNGAAAGVRFQSVVSKYQKLLSAVKIDFAVSSDVRKFYDEFIYDEVKLENPLNLPDGKIFRAGQVEITAGTQKVLHMGAFPEEELIKGMDKALNLLNDVSFAAVLRLAIFHYLFGYLHPFYDGNGRTVRFITSYYLAKALSPLIALNMSLIIKHDKARYYRMFSETSAYVNCGDLGPFVTGFLQIIENAAKDTLTYLRQQSQRYQDYLARINSLPVKDKLTGELYNLLLQAALFSPVGISMQELSGVLKKSRNTISARLDAMPKKHLVVDKEGRQHRFKLNLTGWQ